MSTPKRRANNAGHLRQLPSGKWQAKVPYQDQHIPAPHTFDSKHGAQKWLRDTMQAIADGTWTPPAKATVRTRTPTFADYGQGWLSTRDLRPRTRQHYQRLLDAHLIPAWGKRRIDTITPEQVRVWHAGLLPSSPTMRAHTYSLLRTIMRAAVAEDLIDASPCRVPGAGAVKRASTIDVMTPSQVQGIAEHMPEQYRLAVLIAGWGGLRFGEVAALTRDDMAEVTTADGVVLWRVSVGKSTYRTKGVHKVGQTKTVAGVRQVWLPPHLSPTIGKHLRAHVGRSGEALVFPGPRGGLWAHSTMRGQFSAACETAGVQGVTFHALRHAGATLAAQGGATIRELQDRLGHSTPAAAMRYQHVAADRQAALAVALSNMAQLGVAQ